MRARVAERAERTGRDVPESLWLESLEQVAGSVAQLRPLADVCAVIENANDTPPRLTALTVLGGGSSSSTSSPPSPLEWGDLQASGPQHATRWRAICARVVT